MHINYVSFTIAQQPIVGQRLLFIDDSRSHWVLHTTFVGILWTSGQHDAENSNTQHSQQTDTHVVSGIRTQTPSKTEVTHARSKPLGQWGGLSYVLYLRNITYLQFVALNCNKHMIMHVMKEIKKV